MYLASKSKDNWDNARDVIVDVTNNIKLPENALGETNREIAGRNILSMLNWMCRVHGTLEFDKADLMMRVRVDMPDEGALVKELEMALMSDSDDERIAKRIQSTISNLIYQLRKDQARKLISKANRAINYSDELVDYKEVLQDLQEDIIGYTGETEDGEKPGFVGRLSTSDLSSMEITFDRARENNSPEGVLTTGCVGLNRGCGIGGLRRGEMINFGALSHHFKTGMLNFLARTVPLYNKPFMWDKAKKPLILRVSFENKLDQDLPEIYKALVEQETGETVDIKTVDSKKAAEYVTKRLGVNGYTFDMLNYDANQFKVTDLLDIINEYESKGYEIHLLIIDYLELIVKNGAKDRLDEAINNAFEVVRNHCYPRGITVATAHQLSTQAQDLAREGVTNLPLQVAELGYYRNTKSLQTKLDLEWVMHIHKRDGRSFLVFSRGKHRTGDVTDIKLRTFAYELQKVGGLVDDVEKSAPGVIYNISDYLSNTAEGDEELGDAFGDEAVTESGVDW